MSMKVYQEIIYEKKPPIAYVTLNRPDRMNSFSDNLQLEFRDAFEDAGWNDEDIRVIVVKGAGRCFSAGYDISESPQINTVELQQLRLKGKAFSATTWWDVLWNNPKPVIAQVHGFCVAGGFALVSYCDLCICSEDALFGTPEVRVYGPYLPGAWPWILGMKKAKELLFTGNLIDAQEAYRIGAVNKVVPLDKLEEEVNKLARTIAKVPAVTVDYNKKLVNMAYDLMNIRSVIDRSMELEAACQASSESLPEMSEFFKITDEKGLKAAMTWNSQRFAEEDAWWRNRKK